MNLPPEWTDTFSLVHQRLVLINFDIQKCPVVLGEIYRVLRPGAWVQLAETTAWVEKEYPGMPCMEKLATLFRRVTKSRNLHTDCADDMPRMLEEAGFVDIRRESRMQCMGKWAGNASSSAIAT